MTTKIPNNGLEPGSITTDKLAPNAITGDKLTDNTVTNGKIQDGAIDYDKLAAALLATNSDAIAGTANNKLMSALRTAEAIAEQNVFTKEVFQIRQVGPGNSHTVGTGDLWVGNNPDVNEKIRKINQIVVNKIPGASLNVSLDSFTLPAGEYFVDFQAQYYDIGYHQPKLRNMTDASNPIILTGLTSYNRFSGGEQEPQITPLRGYFALLVETDIQYTYTISSDGLYQQGIGAGATNGENVFLDGIIWKIG